MKVYSHEEKDFIIRVRSGDRFTPFGLTKKLKACALLESSSLNMTQGRYSMLIVHSAFRVIQQDTRVFIRFPDNREQDIPEARDILDALPRMAEQHSPQSFPLPAGGIGYLSFEFCRFCDTITLADKPDMLQMPDAQFLFGHVIIVFDHFRDQIFLVGMNYKEAQVDLPALLDQVDRRIEDLDFSYLQESSKEHYPISMQATDAINQQYQDTIRSLQKDIIAGNIYQVVPSRRISVQTPMDALECYRRVRAANPAPYLFYLNFSDFQLIGASPESLVTVRRKQATMRPIAGTRRRGKTEEEDKALVKDLLSDPKERAEHLMLVDLARNDLGRVCVPHSIEVKDFCHVEYFASVLHLASTVTGKLSPGAGISEIIKATFPAGTLTGAPKIRAIELISQVEVCKRNFYGGVVGYLEPGGNFDTCITIRSAVKKDDLLYIQVGAGIVYDSTPERELEETQEKIAALMSALGLTE